MGDLGLLRRPPKGWLEGVAVSTRHRVMDGDGRDSDPEGGSGELVTSNLADITWEVRVPGRSPYLVEDRDRKVPVWTTETMVGGSGRRFFSFRLKKSFGLMVGVPIPCRVDPDDPGRLWLDWDAGYDAHVEAWDRRSAVDRAVAERKGGWDAFTARVANPLAGRVAPGDEGLVEAALEEERAEQARQLEASRAARAAAADATFAGVDPAERAEFEALSAELVRIHETGVEARGRIVAITPVGRKLMGLDVMRLDVEVSDPAPRAVVWQMPMHPRIAKRYQVGMAVAVRVDRADPSRISISG